MIPENLASCKRVLVTGSREWSTKEHGAVMRKVFDLLDPAATVVHGAAQGADSMAEYGWAGVWDRTTEKHPVDWKRGYQGPDTFDRTAGYKRNDHMVSLGADICIAFIEGDSRGTRQCAASALAAGIPVLFVTLDSEPLLVEPGSANPYSLDNGFVPEAAQVW